MRDWCNGSISALQADRASSNLVSRSIETYTAITFFKVNLAHLVEHLTGNQSVVGSNPTFYF